MRQSSVTAAGEDRRPPAIGNRSQRTFGDPDVREAFTFDLNPELNPYGV
jgi:hypothetical protein